MPKGVFIQDKKVMERFRTAVQDSIPYSLNINKNISNFAQQISLKTRNTISESTLKRLFLYPDSTTPSLYTLDTVCKTIGFASWNDFLEKDKQITDFEHLEIIANIRQEGYQDFIEFKEIITRFAQTSYRFSVTLALVQAAVKKSDFDTLLQLFDLPCIFDIKFHDRPYFYFIQDLGLILRGVNFIEKLVPYYAKNPIAQQAYIERFVDLEYLNGYYGIMMELYHQHKKTQEAQLFYHVLMCMRDVENGVLKSLHYDYLIHFRETEPIHSFPKMRRLALLVIYFHHDAEIVDSILDEIPALMVGHHSESITFMALIFCQTVFLSCDHTVLKRLFDYMNICTDRVSQDILMLRDMNLLKIYEAYFLCKEGKIKEANAKLNSFNRMYQNPYMIIRYKMHYEIVKALIDAETFKNQTAEN